MSNLLLSNSSPPDLDSSTWGNLFSTSINLLIFLRILYIWIMTCHSTSRQLWYPAITSWHSMALPSLNPPQSISWNYHWSETAQMSYTQCRVCQKLRILWRVTCLLTPQKDIAPFDRHLIHNRTMTATSIHSSSSLYHLSNALQQLTKTS